MYESIKQHVSDFTLYYFCFDKKTFDCINKLNLDKIVPIKISDIEDKELLKAKKNRSMAEYFFTLTPSIVWYAIHKFDLEMCIYIDADLYFFNSPEILLENMSNNSVLITEHIPLSQKYPMEGRFNVQFIPFRNDEYGMRVLKSWREKCIEWCFLKSENGKWADQGYLNTWDQEFERVKVLTYYGVIGPWSLKHSSFRLEDDRILVRNKTVDKEYALIFYHFQGLHAKYDYTIVYKSDMDITGNVVDLVYRPYSSRLIETVKAINQICPKLDVLGKLPKPRTIESLLYILKSEKTVKNISSSLLKKIIKIINESRPWQKQ